MVQEDALVARAVLAHAQRSVALRAMAGHQERHIKQTIRNLWSARGPGSVYVPLAVLTHAQRGMALRTMAGHAQRRMKP